MRTRVGIFFEEVSEKGDRLNRFPEAHFVGQYAVDGMPTQQGDPVHSDKLVGLQYQTRKQQKTFVFKAVCSQTNVNFFFKITWME